jgi:hypothetical protein
MSQGTQTKESAAQYYAHAGLQQGASIGADFLGKYLPIPGNAVYSDDYVFVEVALFAPHGRRIEVKDEHFKLRVNGTSLNVQVPGMVTLTNGFPEMSTRPEVVLDAGAGDRNIEVGGPERKPRFPGDDPQYTAGRPLPRTSTDGKQEQPRPVQTPVDAVNSSVLQEGEHALPASGYLCLGFEGKLKKIKHAELIYNGPLGSATLKLR